LQNTPAVLRRLGAPNLKININKDIIDKITGIVKTRMGAFKDESTFSKEIKDAVRDVYGDLDADTLLDEIGAARFTKDQRK